MRASQSCCWLSGERCAHIHRAIFFSNTATKLDYAISCSLNFSKWNFTEKEERSTKSLEFEWFFTYTEWILCSKSSSEYLYFRLRSGAHVPHCHGNIFTLIDWNIHSRDFKWQYFRYRFDVILYSFRMRFHFKKSRECRWEVLGKISILSRLFEYQGKAQISDVCSEILICCLISDTVRVVIYFTLAPFGNKRAQQFRGNKSDVLISGLLDEWIKAAR